MKPKLYQYAACPFCSKVRTMLKYKGADYETIEVHPLNKKEIAFSLDYRAVPIYIDSAGKQVNDSTVIMKWIDEEFPHSAVFETSESGKTKEALWLAWSEKLVKGLPTVIYGSIFDSLKSFNYITKVGKFSWIEKRMIKYSGALIMTLVAKKIKKREAITDPEKFLKQMTAEWAEGLAGNPFMGGETPNAADIALFGITEVVRDLKAGAIFRENKIYEAWMSRMEKALEHETVPGTA